MWPMGFTCSHLELLHSPVLDPLGFGFKRRVRILCNIRRIAMPGLHFVNSLSADGLDTERFHRQSPHIHKSDNTPGNFVINGVCVDLGSSIDK